MNKHRFLSVLLTLALFLALLPAFPLTASAAAAESFCLVLKNVSVPGGAGWSLYHVTTNTEYTGNHDGTQYLWQVIPPAGAGGPVTLVLKDGFEFVTTYNYALLIEAPAVIQVDGDVHIESIFNHDNIITHNSYGISAAKELTVNGSGKLTVRSGDAYPIDTMSYGIYTHTGNLEISGGVTVDASGNEGEGSFGICAAYGDLIISGAVVKATGGDAGNSSGSGIRCEYGGVIINGGAAVDATGGTGGSSHGIIADGNIEISGGAVVKAEGVGARHSSFGIYADGDIEISGGAAVTAKGGGAEGSGDYGGDSAGIYSEKGSVEITDSTVEAAGGEGETDSYGIYAEMTASSPKKYCVVIDGSTVTASAAISPGRSHGIHSGGRTLLTGDSLVKAEAGAAANDPAASAGIFTRGLHFDGFSGAVFAAGNSAAIRSYDMSIDKYTDNPQLSLPQSHTILAVTEHHDEPGCFVRAGGGGGNPYWLTSLADNPNETLKSVRIVPYCVCKKCIECGGCTASVCCDKLLNYCECVPCPGHKKDPPPTINDSYIPPDMTPYYGYDPADIPSNWAQAAVEKALKLGLVPANLQGKWRDNLSRADFDV